jgi:hypothetical protein
MLEAEEILIGPSIAICTPKIIVDTMVHIASKKQSKIRNLEVLNPVKNLAMFKLAWFIGTSRVLLKVHHLVAL